MRRAVTRSLYQIHKWTGLVVAVLLLGQAITGLTLQHKEFLNDLLYPVAPLTRDATPLSVDALYSTARRAQKNANIERITFAHSPENAAIVRAITSSGERRFAAIDPGTGTIIAAGGYRGFPTEAAFFFHHDLLLGPPGLLVIGVLGLATVTLGVTGLILWWPGLRRLRPALRITLKPPALRYLYDLHKSPGALASLVLIAIGLTGSGIAFRAELSATLAAVAPMQPAPDLTLLPRPDDDSRPTLASMVERGRAAVDSKTIKDLRFAGERDRLFGLLFRADAQPDSRAVDQVWFDRLTGRQLDAVPASARQPADRFLDWLLPVHTGEVAGATGKAIMTIVGIVLFLVALTGLLLWFERHKLRRRRKPRSSS